MGQEVVKSRTKKSSDRDQRNTNIEMLDTSYQNHRLCVPLFTDSYLAAGKRASTTSEILGLRSGNASLEIY
jgi:hypothetical protein